MNAVNFLVNTLFDLYIMVVILRVWLQLARADFYNPFSQFVVKATQPFVAPLRRFIPGLGGLDIATILFAIVVAGLKVLTISLLLHAQVNIPAILIGAVITVIMSSFKIVFWVLILRAILSWISRGYNPIEAVMIQLTEPLLAPVRRFIPPMGGLDLSMLVVLIGLHFFELLMSDFIMRLLG